MAGGGELPELATPEAKRFTYVLKFLQIEKARDHSDVKGMSRIGTLVTETNWIYSIK